MAKKRRGRASTKSPTATKPAATTAPAKPAAKSTAKSTAKGPGRGSTQGAAKGPAPTPSKRVTPKGTGRYTPPIPRTQKVSPVWVPVLMFTCLLGGMLMIILNYVNVLPSSPSNWWLLGGLGLITAGFITATKYH